jgi:predicted phosphoribosyltransferase
MFKDRYDAAIQLAKALEKYKDQKDAIILAIPRGALQIGEVLCEELHIPLDIIVTKKIPHPMSEEYAIGAVGPEGEHFVNPEHRNMAKAYVEGHVKRISVLVEEKYKRYRGDRPKPVLEGKTVILVDDGIATGSTILAKKQQIK